MLTRKQHELLVYIKDRLTETGVSPSFEEMKDALGLHSKSGIHRLVSALEERGFLRRLAHRARALEILKLPEDLASPVVASSPVAGDRVVRGAMTSDNVVRGDFAARPSLRSDQGDASIAIPLHGRIAAGTPIEALQNSDVTLSVPASMLSAGTHFALEVDGDSMVDAGILDGDKAIIKSCDTAENGDIVVALVDEEEATLKTLHKRGDQIALKPANAAYSTQLLPADRVRIQGKLVGIIRSY